MQRSERVPHVMCVCVNVVIAVLFNGQFTLDTFEHISSQHKQRIVILANSSYFARKHDVCSAHGIQIVVAFYLWWNFIYANDDD